MKIAVLSSHTQSLFWFRMDMMKAFIESGHTVLALGQEPEEEWCDKFLQYGIKYKCIPVERNGINPFHDIKTLNALKKFMSEEKPDKVFTYQAKTIVYGSMAAHKYGISEVYTLIAGLGSVFRGHGFKNSIIKAVMKFEYKLACRYSKSILFQNNDDKDTFISNKLTTPEKTNIINGSGVNIEKFVVTPLPKQTSFLFIGRLIKDKGIYEYLEACKAVKDAHPEVRCLLVGPFDSNPSALHEEELKPYIEDGIIEYYGEQSDVRPYINQCSVYVLPSYHEGTPKTILEAMASGRAVITTQAPGCRETVINNSNGYLVPTKSIDAVVEKMNYLILHNEIIEKMGIAGRKMAVDKYDVNKVNKDILRIMQLQNNVDKCQISL